MQAAKGTNFAEVQKAVVRRFILHSVNIRPLATATIGLPKNRGTEEWSRRKPEWKWSTYF